MQYGRVRAILFAIYNLQMGVICKYIYTVLICIMAAKRGSINI